MEGLAVGWAVGLLGCELDGVDVGFEVVECAVGQLVGAVVGVDDVGTKEGDVDGIEVGDLVGALEVATLLGK